MRILCQRDLEWVSYEIPDSAPAVRLAELPAGRPPSLSALVRFPRGWSRPGAGHYPVAEEVLFIEGALTVSHRDYHAGDYAWFAPGYLRTGSHAPDGALALAWFGGATRWTRGHAPVRTQAGAARRECRWSDLPSVASPFGAGTARRLPAGGGGSSWILELPTGGATPVGPGLTVELFSLTEMTWALAEPGDALPSFAGPTFVRIIGRRDC